MLNQHTLTTRCMIGLIQGLFLYLLTELSKHNFFLLESKPYLLMPLYVVGIYVPFLLVQGMGNMRRHTLIKWISLASSLLAALSFYAIYRQMLPGMTPQQLAGVYPGFDFFLATTIAIYIAHSLVISGDQDNKFIAHYPTYFDIAWKLEIQIMLTCFYVSLFWGLLSLGAGLFQVIHLSFFSTLISKSWFAIPASTLAAAAALHVTDINIRMIAGMRTLLLTLLSWLLPIITLIATLFLCCLFMTGTSILWQTKYAGLMLVWVGLIFVLLINSSYQEGSRITALSRWQRMIAQLACCVLTPFMFLAMWALALRVQQYGWTPTRIYAATCMCILTVYSLGYLAAVIFTRATLNLIERVNIGVSFLILASYLFLFSPVGDPARLFVSNQMARLQTGVVTVEKFDFIALRFKGERYGHQALSSMEESENGVIRAKVKETLALSYDMTRNDYYGNADQSARIKWFDIHTNDGKLPESFIAQKWGNKPYNGYPDCLRGLGKCQAWLQADGTIMLLDWRGFYRFKQNKDKQWDMLGSWNLPSRCANQIYRVATEKGYKLVAPLSHYQDIEVAGQRLTFQPYQDDQCGD